MFTPKGKFGWYELMTSDTKAAGKFYSDVVGWTTQEMTGGDGPPYTTFTIGNVGIAGMLNIPGHTAWVGYISVDDVDAHIEKIVEAGGKIWRPATDVPGMLRFAVMSDPQGAAIVVFTANPAMPTPERPGADAMTREAYSHEVSSVGFWPGGDIPGAAFYSYMVPEPQEFKEARVRPGAAYYDRQLGEFLLMYEDVRKAESPSASLLEFCQSTYEVGASLSKWDRDALER